MSAATSSVLYDAPGPNARRRYAIYGVIGGFAIASLVGLVAWRLYEQDQFTEEKWGPLLNPNNEVFGQVWALLGEGIVKTLIAASLAIVLSTVIGTMLGVARLLLNPVARIPLIGVLEVLRGLPVVIAIYFASRVLPSLGVDLSGMPGGEQLWFLLIGLTLYNSVVIAEILRAGVQALPRGQREAALAIGLSRRRAMMLVELPQAVRSMLPALISQVVVIVKDTSLAAVLGLYPELLYQGKTIILNLKNPIQTYIVVGAMFIAANMALSWFAQWLQRRMSTRTAAQTDPAGALG